MLNELSILNVGHGDTKITFDKNNPKERERACKIVQDMLRRGYAILAQAGEKDGKPIFFRVTAFDPETAEYIVVGDPEETQVDSSAYNEASPVVQRDMRRKGKRTRLPAESTPAVAVARSAGGMSDQANSVEMENLRRADGYYGIRNAIARLAEERSEWAGIPMPLEDLPLTVEPTYPRAKELMEYIKKDVPKEEPGITLRNRFYCAPKRADVYIFDSNGKIEWGLEYIMHGAGLQISTMLASKAWGIEQEANALQLLGQLIPHHLFKMYLLTGMFMEKSRKSKVLYIFRKLKPTIALAAVDTGGSKILAALCMHPIAYYQGSWAGAMCPTDDVIAHLVLMRGDEKMFWRRCNQHPAIRPEAGL